MSGAVTEIQGLSGLPINQILASVDGGATLVVGDVAKLVANVLNLVLGAVGKLLGGGLQGDVSSLVSALAPIVYVFALDLPLYVLLTFLQQRPCFPHQRRPRPRWRRP